MAAELQLETLVTRIIADATQFMQATEVVMNQIVKINSAFDSIARHVGLAGGAIADLSFALKGLANAIPVISTSGIASSIQQITVSLSNLNTLNMSATLKDFAGGLSALASSSLTGLADKLKELGKAFAESGLGKAVIPKAATGLSTLSVALGTFRDSIGGIDPDVGKNISNAINDIDGAMGNATLHHKKTLAFASNVDALAKSLSGLATLDSAALTSVGDAVGKTINVIGKAVADSKLHLASVKGAFENLQLLPPVLQAFSGLNLSGMSNVRVAVEDLFGGSAMRDLLVDSKIGSAAVGTAVTNLSSLAGALRILSRTKLGNIGDVNQTLFDLFKAGTLAKTLGTSGLTEEGPVAAIMSLRRLATALNVFSKLDLAEATARMGAIATPISTLATGLAGLGTVSGVLEKVASSLKTLARIGTEAFGKRIDLIGTSIQGLATNLGGLSGVKISGVLPDLDKLVVWVAAFKDVPAVAINRLAKISTAIAPLGPALTALSNANMTAALANGQQLMKWLTTFNAINPASVTVISKMGQALAGMANFLTAAGAAGGNLPPIINNISTSAGGAGGPVRRLTNSMGGLSSATTAASGSVRVLKYGLVGLAAVSVAIFAKLDDQLTHTLAHMQEINKEPMSVNRPVVEAGIRNIAFSTPTSMSELAKGFDALARSGKNASMAIADLEVAESFALISGMKVGDASKRLSTILGSFGRDVVDPEEHLKRFGKLGDIITGTAFKSNTTATDLANSLNDKVVSAARAAGIEMEDVVAMMGAYARAGTPMQEAGDRAARAINELNLRTSENEIRWQIFLQNTAGIDGVAESIRTTTGALKPMDQLLEMISKRFAGLSPRQSAATEKLLGMEMRSIVAIRPLIDQFAHMRELKEQFGGFEGVVKEIARIIRQDFLNQLRILWNQISGVAYIIGQALGPALEVVTNTLGVALKAFNSLNPAIRNLAVYAVFAATGLWLLRTPLMWLAVQGYRAFVLMMVGISKFAGAVVGVGISSVRVLKDALVGLAKAIISTWSMIPIVFGSIFSFLDRAVVVVATVALDTISAVVDGLIYLEKHGVRMIIGTVSSAYSILRTGFTSTVNAVIAGVMSLVAGIIPLFVTLIIWIPLLVAGFSFVVTSAISLGQVFKAVFGSISLTWDHMRDKAGKVTRGIAEAFDSAGRSIVGMWDNFKGGAAEAFDSVVARIKVLAGFFWNFRENMKIIIEWLKVNWRNAAEDIGRFLVSAIEASVKNIVTLLSFAFQVGKDTFGTIWEEMGWIALSVFNGIGRQWKNMLGDMGAVFKAFAFAFLENFVTILGKTKDVTKYGILRYEYGQPKEISSEITRLQKIVDANVKEGLGEHLSTKAIKQKIARYESQLEELKGMEKGLFDGFVGPGDYLEGTKFKTDFGPMRKDFGRALGGAKGSFSSLGERIADLWKGVSLVNPFAPPGEGYKAPWQKLIDSFNTKGSPGGIMEMINKVLNPTPGSPEGVGGQPGRGGPGYTFKQISESRYMLGGPTAELLDYQQLQTLKSIDDKTRNTANAANRIVAILEGGPTRPEHPPDTVPNPAVYPFPVTD